MTGPYSYKDGKDFLHGGGTSFLETKGRFIGPGRAGIYWEAGHSWVNEWPVVIDEGKK